MTLHYGCFVVNVAQLNSYLLWQLLFHSVKLTEVGGQPLVPPGVRLAPELLARDLGQPIRHRDVCRFRGHSWSRADIIYISGIVDLVFVLHLRSSDVNRVTQTSILVFLPFSRRIAKQSLPYRDSLYS